MLCSYLRPFELWNMTSAWLRKLLHGHLTYPFQDKISCLGPWHNQRPGLESTTTGPCSPLQSSATTLCLEKCKFFLSRMPMNDLIRTLDKKIFINSIMMEIHASDNLLAFFKYHHFCFNIYNFTVSFNFADHHIVVFLYFVSPLSKTDNLVHTKKFAF